MTRLRWKRLTGRILAVAVLVLATLVLTARPAAADICTGVPTPVQPKSGLPGMLTSTPRTIPDQTPNPFTDKSVSIGQVYGYNWSWSNYDLGCGPDFLRDPIAVTNTKTANVILSMVGGTLAGLASLEQLSKTSSLGWLTDVVGGIADKLRTPVLTLWLPLAMFGVGLIVAFKAKRTSYAETMRTLWVIGLAVVMAVFALAFPTTASNTVDRAVVAVSNATGSQFSASPSGAITKQSAYRVWLTGNFGDPDSALARQLGPQLLDATHYSWTDMKHIQADPAAKRQIDARKASEFRTVARELKAQDPAGYEEFTGRGERTGPALFGVVLVLAMSLFVFVAMLMVLVARVMMQGLALAAPLAAVIGVLPTHRSVLARLWDLFTAALVAVAKFVIAGGVMTMVLGAIASNAGLGAAAQLFWIVVATVVGLMITRPVRSFKTVIPGLDPDRSYLRTAMSGVASFIGARAGAESVGPDLIMTDTQEPTAGGVPAATAQSRDARESLEPLPSPAWVPVEHTSVVQVDAPARQAADAQQWEHGRAWPGVVTSAPQPELPPARHELPAGTEPDLAPSAAGSLPAVEQPAARPATDDRFPRPRPSAPYQSGSEVIYPTGVIVADDAPLYRSKTENSHETYVPLGDRELAQDGTEQQLVTYHSRVRAASGAA